MGNTVAEQLVVGTMNAGCIYVSMARVVVSFNVFPGIIQNRKVQPRQSPTELAELRRFADKPRRRRIVSFGTNLHVTWWDIVCQLTLPVRNYVSLRALCRALQIVTAYATLNYVRWNHTQNHYLLSHCSVSEPLFNVARQFPET